MRKVSPTLFHRFSTRSNLLSSTCNLIISEHNHHGYNHSNNWLDRHNTDCTSLLTCFSPIGIYQKQGLPTNESTWGYRLRHQCISSKGLASVSLANHLGRHSHLIYHPIKVIHRFIRSSSSFPMTLFHPQPTQKNSLLLQSCRETTQLREASSKGLELHTPN